VERASFALPPGADRDSVDDAILATGMRLCAVLPSGAGVQVVAVSPDRRTKATYVSLELPVFAQVVIEGAHIEETAARLGALGWAAS
jgi:hypothetical protein